MSKPNRFFIALYLAVTSSEDLIKLVCSRGSSNAIDKAKNVRRAAKGCIIGISPLHMSLLMLNVSRGKFGML